MEKFITIDHFNFKEKRALIRVDFNVPLNKTSFEVTDDTRMTAALNTINKILDDGGSVVLMSHLGRPKGGPEEKYSLNHVVKYLSKLLSKPVQFANDCIGTVAFEMSSKLKSGEVLLLENLRFYAEEEKGDINFAEKLAEHGDIYVNDAFGTAHRAHASTTIVAQFFKDKKCFGYLMAAEIKSVNLVLNETKRPFTAILGGAKVSDKILILENLLDKADNIIIGGGMAFTFLKALGYNIGASLCEDDRLELAKEIMDRAKSRGMKFLLPLDAVIADKFSNEAARSETPDQNVPESWMGLDIGKKSIQLFDETIMNSKTILWNGPMGVFEMENFANGTKSIAYSVADSTAKGAFSLVGGGDSVAAVNKFNLDDKVSYVSTGGGALLECFEGKVLPGIQAILD